MKTNTNQPEGADTNMEGTQEKEIIKPEEVQTSIDIKDDVMHVQINLKKGAVNTYGTLAYAQEMSSRYFLTKEIMAKRAAAEEESGKVKVLLPKGIRL